MTAAIANLLTELQAPGSFATRLRASMDDLEVEVKGVGRLRGPMSVAMGDKLRRVARPAPFGLREATTTATGVRARTMTRRSSRAMCGASSIATAIAPVPGTSR